MRRRKDLSTFLSRRRLSGDGVIAAPADIAAELVAGWPPPHPRVVGASQSLADGPVDSVYLGGATEYGPTRDLLRTWYPNVRAGGFLAGSGYLDGLFRGKLYGVRTAVNEFAQEHSLVVRLTLDEVQTWFVFKPMDKPRPKPRIALLMAYDQRQRDVAAISSPNKAQYCKLHGYDFIEETSGFPTDRPANWAKVALLRKHLPRYDWVFWSDADSLVMDLHKPLEAFCDPEADMVICHEDMGQGVYNVNSGQMLLRSCDWSQWFLEEVWGQAWAVKDRLQEQRAIIHMLFSREVGDQVMVVAQKTFNCYPSNYGKGDFLLHFPDMPTDKRLEAMRYWAQFAIP